MLDLCAPDRVLLSSEAEQRLAELVSEGRQLEAMLAATLAELIDLLKPAAAHGELCVCPDCLPARWRRERAAS